MKNIVAIVRAIRNIKPVFNNVAKSAITFQVRFVRAGKSAKDRRGDITAGAVNISETKGYKGLFLVTFKSGSRSIIPRKLIPNSKSQITI